MASENSQQPPSVWTEDEIEQKINERAEELFQAMIKEQNRRNKNYYQKPLTSYYYHHEQKKEQRHRDCNKLNNKKKIVQLFNASCFNLKISIRCDLCCKRRYFFFFLRPNLIHLKKIDNYSMMIVGKYFKTKNDYINLIMTNSRFKRFNEMYLFNPISISSLNLFPSIKTLFLFNQNDVNEYLMKQVKNIVISFKISYSQYLYYKRFYSSISFKNISYTEEDCFKFGKTLKDSCHSLENDSLEYYNSQIISFGSTLRNIGSNSLSKCPYLKELNLPSTILTLNTHCFSCNYQLTSVTISALIKELPSYCFFKCTSLQQLFFYPKSNSFAITQFNNSCFEQCINLSILEIPSSITKIGSCCFFNCYSLTMLKIPKVDSDYISNTIILHKSNEQHSN
ncbi:hypothetical protein EDI_194810 [Entamoeba dispar SAW760]|uniref:Leucine rich repeat containing protein BspA family protein n=1 Tax=Entamoeba dispar (strain ATCC PRA-260 / SAW760) TaxID=370354 RepID=B0EES9_ENTDS|nr:uncharacterized protein EDI_194810 [Entamoeba dispar SAW760]EDR26962.1 hypothetical protein EDI_194810 [Entamoeba dispar SAW760]|eukprot:EDR26962.1 hypothetical protein EDI_194810 [Entamoeba dispar SAW760]